MGHDHHFLSRLDRVCTEHVELALGLYRDAELVEHILSYSGVPESAPRIAISLGSERGPFVIVSRDGHFVTCLAEGMLPLSTPVVPRSRLDTIAGHVGKLQDRMRVAKRMAPGGELGDLLQSVIDAGDSVSREEMYGLFAVSPLLAASLFHSMTLNAKALHGGLHTLLAMREAGPREEAILRGYWQLSWAMAHQTLLCGIECPAGYPDPLPIINGEDPRAYLSMLTMITGLTPHAVRGVWSASVAGDRIFDRFERRYREAEQSEVAIEATLVLAALGLRYPALLADVRRVLRGSPGADGAAAGIWDANHHAMLKPMEDIFNDPAGAVRFLERAAQQYVHGLGKHLPYGSAAHFMWPEEVPSSISLPMVSMASTPILRSPLDVLHGLQVLAWAVSVPGEELYPPLEYVQALREGWSLAKGYAMLEATKMSFPAVQSSRASKRPGPNEPCDCGSGKKYKKCCWKKQLA